MYNQALCLIDVAYFKDDIRVFPVVSESTVITIAGSVKNGRRRHKPVGFTKFFWEISFFLSQKPPLICLY